MQLIAPAQQLLKGIAAELTATLPGSDGEPRSGLAATVTVARADGTVLYTNAAATDNGDGTYALALSGTDLSQLDLLVAQWTVAANVRATTAHEVVGGFYFTQADVAIAEQGRAAVDGQDHATLRAEVEHECERICNVAFVPRYARVVVNATGTGRLLLPYPMPRVVRSVRIYSNGIDYVSLTPADIAALSLDPSGLIERRDYGIFGFNLMDTEFAAPMVIVEYEHGYDQPPADLKRATIRRYRGRSNMAKSGLPDRAVTYTAENGATYRIATADEYSTGDPDIDAIYDGYAFKANRYGIA